MAAHLVASPISLSPWTASGSRSAHQYQPWSTQYMRRLGNPCSPRAWKHQPQPCCRKTPRDTQRKKTAFSLFTPRSPRPSIPVPLLTVGSGKRESSIRQSGPRPSRQPTPSIAQPIVTPVSTPWTKRRDTPVYRQRRMAICSYTGASKEEKKKKNKGSSSQVKSRDTSTSRSLRRRARGGRSGH